MSGLRRLGQAVVAAVWSCDGPKVLPPIAFLLKFSSPARKL